VDPYFRDNESSEASGWPHIEVYMEGNPILQETELGEYLSHIVGGWWVGYAHSLCIPPVRHSSRCELRDEHKSNEPTPWGIRVFEIWVFGHGSRLH
jgi:hypothetical protein